MLKAQVSRAQATLKTMGALKVPGSQEDVEPAGDIFIYFLGLRISNRLKDILKPIINSICRH